MIWFYGLSAKLMCRQLLLGAELELYSQADYPFIFYYLEYVYSIIEKNNINLIARFDKEFLQCRYL